MSNPIPLALASKLVVPAQVVARTVGEETVVLDLVSGTYYGLDAIGARIWNLLGEGRTVGDALAVMLEEYDVASEQLERDGLQLIGELIDKQLIAVA